MTITSVIIRPNTMRRTETAFTYTVAFGPGRVARYTTSGAFVKALHGEAEFPAQLDAAMLRNKGINVRAAYLAV